MPKISQLNEYTGNTEDIWFICNNSGETETFKVNKTYITPVAGFSWVDPGSGGAYPTSDQYGNLTNGSDNYIPFNTTIFNTNTNVFELVNSGSVSGTLGDTGARLHIKVPGVYQISGQMHFFDLFGNIDFLVKISSSSTSGGVMSPITLLHDYKSAELTNDQLMNGTVFLDVTTAGYYTICVNPSANSPFPSATDNTPTRFFIQKIS